MSMSDSIQGLPLLRGQPSAQDYRVLESMFGSGSNGPSSSMKLLVPGILFFVLSLPFVDKFLKGIITSSDLVLLVIKTGLFLAILLVAQLIGLA